MVLIKKDKEPKYTLIIKTPLLWHIQPDCNMLIELSSNIFGKQVTTNIHSILITT